MNRIKTLVSSIAFATYSASTMAQTVLEEVIVTAQKRAVNIQEVPISITALSLIHISEPTRPY